MRGYRGLFAGDERPPTPALEITSVQSIPLSSYEAPNGTAAAVSQDIEDKQVGNAKKQSVKTII